MLLVLCGIAWPAAGADTKPMTTMLVVARAELPDPNFRDSIVLVMNHLGSAPAGVILNRPTRMHLSHLFPDLEHRLRPEQKLYFGGPVNLRAVSFLFRATERPEHAIEVLDRVYFSTDRGLLRDLLVRERPPDGLRVFVGHAGWASGQLEGEIARGDWSLAPADANAIFGGKSERPWPDPREDGGQRAARRSLRVKATSSLGDTTSIGLDFGEIHKRSNVGVHVFSVSAKSRSVRVPAMVPQACSRTCIAARSEGPSRWSHDGCC